MQAVPAASAAACLWQGLQVSWSYHGPIFYNTLYILGDSIKQTKEHLAQTVAEFLQDISQWYYQQMKEDALIIIIFPVARVVVHSEFTLDLHPW